MGRSDFCRIESTAVLKTQQNDPYQVFDEHQIQTALFRAWKKRGLPGAIMFAVPNGGARDVVTARRLKDEGVVAGAPDICAIVGGATYFIEVKRARGALSDQQKAFQAKLREAGALARTVYGYIQAIKMLEDIGVIRRPAPEGGKHGQPTA